LRWCRHNSLKSRPDDFPDRHQQPFAFVVRGDFFEHGLHTLADRDVTRFAIDDVADRVDARPVVE
jgi:hypothetical protein